MNFKKPNNMVIEATEHISWWKLILITIVLIGLSLGIYFLFRDLASRWHIPIDKYAWLAYLVVFLTSLISNLTIIAPVPFALSVMIAAAAQWNPVLVTLSAAVGACIGELSGYFAGYMGRKIVIPQSKLWHSRFERWIKKYGVWAIFGLALQPVLPFDIAGLVAGAAKMPLYKFMPALFAGRFPKYIIFVYLGVGMIHHLPFLNL